MMSGEGEEMDAVRPASTVNRDAVEVDVTGEVALSFTTTQ
jgi:hypothetical protein